MLYVLRIVFFLQLRCKRFMTHDHLCTGHNIYIMSKCGLLNLFQYRLAVEKFKFGIKGTVIYIYIYILRVDISCIPDLIPEKTIRTKCNTS